MSDFTYQFIRQAGLILYRMTSRPTILHRERSDRPGGYILAANHLSPYDVAALIGATRRPLDFLSIVEFRDKPLVGSFFRAMNCVFLDRGRTDAGATRAVVSRLKRGRVVAMFPEGNIRTPETSVINGAPFKPGVVRMAELAGVPIVPVVVVGTGAYSRFNSWHPIKGVRFGVAYGDAIDVTDRDAAMGSLRKAYVDLYRELPAAVSKYAKWRG